MIEKLKGYITDITMIRKIDELVDAVNGILYWHENLPRFWQNLSQKENTENEEPDGDDAIQEVIHKEPADPYAEQRKWIGKLCKFWDDNYKITKHFGVLTRIDEMAIVKYEAENGFWYCACEPVKPDDDIIYKGE